MEVFVFPMMNVTLFPLTAKPLNIYEAQYVELFKDAVRENKPIALAFSDDIELGLEPQSGSKLVGVREIAGFGYATIVDEQQDGTMMVFVHGKGKVRLGKVLKTNKLYTVCEAEIIEETYNIDDKNIELLAGLYKILKRWVNHHIKDAHQREIFLKNIRTPQEVLGTFCTYMVRDYDLQQYLLEENDVNLKLHTLLRLLESNELSA